MKRKQLCRVEKGEMVSGVCMGFSHYFNIDVSIIRLIFVAMIFFGVGSPILVYFVLAVILPKADPDDWQYVEVEDTEEDEADYYDPSVQKGFKEEDPFESYRSDEEKQDRYK